MPRRPSRPLLIVRPSRAGGLTRHQARLVLAVVMIVTLVVLAISGPAIDPADVLIRDATLVERLRHDDGFYSLAADTLRSGGEAVRPALAFPLPGLPVILAALPLLVASVLMIALAAIVVMAWHARLAPLCHGGAGRAALLVLLIAGVVVAGNPDLIVAPEAWAGLFIALSLVRRHPGRWVEAAGFGLAAALIHGASALYLIAMTALAWREGHGREATGWAGTLAILVAVFAFHLHGVAGISRPFDSAGDIAAWAGWAAGLVAIAGATGAAFLPPAPGAALVMLATIGWAAWRDPLAIRAAVTLLGFAAVMASGVPVMGGLLVAPIALVGLVFIPDLLRDLTVAALDNRRITVTRSVR